MNNNPKQSNSFQGIAATLFVLIVTQAMAYIAREKDTLYLHWIGIFIVALQLVVFVPSSGLLGNEPTEKFFDLTGGMTYLSTIIITVWRLKSISSRQLVVCIASGIWSIRLGLFLFMRISKNNGVDSRFTELKQTPSSFLTVWAIQGLWVFLTLLSVLITCQDEDVESLKFVNILGIAIWILGFAIEAVADFQKSSFKSNHENRDKWISTGLWSVSRHPNYFGEIVLWLGIALTCIKTTQMTKKTLLLFISPLFVAFLLIFISGIPLLEKKADQRFGQDEEYKKYKESTPVLIPFVW